MWSPEGLGADDRAGVYAILRILKTGLRPHVIFTTDEEKGGIGAYSIAIKCQDFFNKIKYIIELDRQGSHDCVFYECNNRDFVRYVESFGFFEELGSFSDISYICPEWKVAGVNLSIGYKNEHSYVETLHISHFFATIDKVIKMLKDAEQAPYFEYIPNYDRWKKFFPTEDWYGIEPKQVICEVCGRTWDEEDTFAVKGLNNQTKYYCIDCCSDKIEWCSICQEPFEISPEYPNAIICPDCDKEIHGKGMVKCITQKSKKNSKK